MKEECPNLNVNISLTDKYKIIEELPLKQLYVSQILTQNLEENFSENCRKEYIHNTRSKLNKPLATIVSGNKYKNRTKEYLIPKLYNQLPIEIKEITNLIHFKRAIKNHLIQNPIIY